MTEDDDRTADLPDVRTRILNAASRLIASGGVEALTTRAVAAAAGTQGPTLYRLFGEKRGLLHAVAEHSLAQFVAAKAEATPHSDPVRDLSDAWESYVAFGVGNPAVFAIMNGVGSDAAASPAALAGIETLRKRVERVARAGRLGVPVERAVALIHAAGLGTVATLLTVPANKRDAALTVMARDAVLAAIVTDPPVRSSTGLAPLAVALGARLDEAQELTPGERLLLYELLSRLASTAQPDS